MEELKSYRKAIYVFSILGIGILFITNPQFKSFASGLTILFTAGSTEQIVGYLKSAGTTGPFLSILAMILQALVFPFSYTTLTFANVSVYGTMFGFLLSFTGRTLGAYLCYDLARSLIPKVFSERISKRMTGNPLLTWLKTERSGAFFFRLIPGNFDLMSYLSGVLAVESKSYLLSSCFWIALTTGIYTIRNYYFSRRLEVIANIVRFLAAIVLLAIIKKKTTYANGNRAGL